MQIGAMNHPARDPLEEQRWMAEMGLDFLDLTIEPPAASPERIMPQPLLAALRESGMDVVGHTAFYAPIASAMPAMRAAAVSELKKALAVFAELGAAWVNIHPDAHTHFHDRAANVRCNLEALRELVEEAQRLRVGVMIENVPGEYNNAQQMGELLTQIPQLGMLLDIGHTNLRVPPNTNTAIELIDAFGDRIRHVHLHDNYGGAQDLHLPLGVGHVAYREPLAALKRRGYDGTITLEVFAPDKRYFAMSRDILREAWEAA